MKVLAKYVCLEVVEADTQWEPLGYTIDRGDRWRDSMLIARKPCMTGGVAIKWAIKKKTA